MPVKKKIVIAFDGSDGAEDALALGIWFAAATNQVPLAANVYPDEVMPVLPGVGIEWVRELRKQAEEVLGNGRKLVAGQDCGAEFMAVPGSSASRGLEVLAKESHASVIIIGSSHRGVLRRVGSSHTADRLLQGGSVPVLVVPRGFRHRTLEPPSDIGCAFLPNPEGGLALRTAADLAARAGARLKIFSVANQGPEHTEADSKHRKRLLTLVHDALRTSAEEAIAGLSVDVETSVHVLDGGVVDALAALDEQDCQLLVCGSRGYGPVSRVLLGGVSSRLIRRATCPLLVVPRASKD